MVQDRLFSENEKERGYHLFFLDKTYILTNYLLGNVYSTSLPKLLLILPAQLAKTPSSQQPKVLPLQIPWYHPHRLSLK